MYRNSRFREILKGLSRGMVDRIAQQCGSDKHTKQFRSWDHLVAMMFAQLSGSKSLRELEVGFNAQANHHYHLGTKAIKRSTLADANNKRSVDFFAKICGVLLAQAHKKVKHELSEILYLLDSTPIQLKGLGFDDWTSSNHSHRTQGLKVHVLYAEHEKVPVDIAITAPNVNDINVGREFSIEEKATYVFDMGYTDYNWWNRIKQQGSYFVTRFKRTAALIVESELAIPKKDQLVIVSDTKVRFKHKSPGGTRKNHYTDSLRRIVVRRENGKDDLVLATNDFKSSATAIANFYKKRWEIELFFKWIKQHLKIKSFLGRSENAVRIQLLTAIISYLLLTIYRKTQRIKESLHLCCAVIKTGLFQRRATEEHHLRCRERSRNLINATQYVLAL
jgi:putative transposase